MEWFLVSWKRHAYNRKNIPLFGRLLFLIFPLLIASWVSLACSIALGGPDAPGAAITPDDNATDISLVWSHAYAARQNRQWVVIFTESQLTAYMESRLVENQSIPLHQPQVFLRDGKVSVYGQYQTDAVSAAVLIVIQPTIHEDGTVEWIVSDGMFGPVHLPTSALTAISDNVHQALTSPVGSVATGFQVKEVLIGDGQIAIRCQAET
jgi:hypothetical protein